MINEALEMIAVEPIPRHTMESTIPSETIPSEQDDGQA